MDPSAVQRVPPPPPTISSTNRIIRAGSEAGYLQLLRCESSVCLQLAPFVVQRLRGRGPDVGPPFEVSSWFPTWGQHRWIMHSSMDFNGLVISSFSLLLLLILVLCCAVL